jgi:hypothetical protein
LIGLPPSIVSATANSRRAVLQQAGDAVEVLGALAAGHLAPDGVEGRCAAW